MLQYMHVAPPLSVGTAYKQDAVQPRGVSMIMSSDSATAVPYGMVPQFSTLQIGSPVSETAGPVRFPANDFN